MESEKLIETNGVYYIKQIMSKYNHLTADEAKKIILLVAFADGCILAVKDLKRPEA